VLPSPALFFLSHKTLIPDLAFLSLRISPVILDKSFSRARHRSDLHIY
jgi:hypothetical protein